MKSLFLVLLILYSIHSFSQQKEERLDSSRAKGSMVLHSTTATEDSLPSPLSDTINPSIFGQINQLDEVFIKPKPEYNAVSLGILKKEIKTLTPYERQLYTAGDFKAVHLLSLLGGSLDVDPIINAISGRTKRLKKYINFEKKESNLIFLEDHFMEYMVDTLNIREQIIGRFLNYLIEDEKLQDLIDRKDFGELYFFIGDEWFEFERLQTEPFPLNNEKKTH